MKPKKVFRIEMKEDLSLRTVQLRKGQVWRTEAESFGTNWIKVRIPQGPIKTLFNFEAKWSLAD